MRLSEMRKEFESGIVAKTEYIQKMYDFHLSLFDYSKYLKMTDIRKIEIADDEIIVTTRKDDIKIVVPKADQRIIPIEILNFGQYESEVSDMMIKLIKDESTVLDVGCNIGWISLILSKNVNKIQVFGFEPIPQTYSLLERNLKINEVKNVAIFNFGLSNEDKNLSFYYYPEGSGNASMANLSGHEHTRLVECSVKRLDSIVNTFKAPIDFIKIDVEGAELFVLQGGEKTIQAQKPIIFAEMLRKWAAKFNYHPNSIIEFLQNIGYSCFTVNGENLVVFNRMDDATSDTNFFFLHQERHQTLIETFVK